ncbi:MAG: T9SS type A sorting domain-containing protein, partial [Bacteroidia bacterium]|nr:T9SS type A sorting domain-containing protein [Bacteroidia bacterium]
TYSRSEDAGVTWNIAHDILPGYDSTLYAAGVGADAYAIDAIGTNVAIVAGGITEDWAIWKSTDNGTTFTKIIVSDFPFDNYDDVNSITDVDMDGYADTVLTTDGKMAILIDNNGMIHTWAGAMLVLDQVIADPLSLFLSTDGLLYWNEGMGANPPVSIAESPDLDMNGTLDFAYDYVPRYGNGGQTTQPRAGIDASGNIVVSYVTLIENTTSGNPSPGDFSYRNNFLIASDDNGANWFNPYNVGNSNYDECVYASIPRNLNSNCVDVVWQQDALPGIAVQAPNGDQSLHPFSNNDIFHDCVDINLLFVGVNEIENPSLSIGTYPNPATDELTISVNLEHNEELSFDVINTIGQIVLSIDETNYASGKSSFSINVKDLEDGIYLIRANSQNYSNTIKFIKN